MRSRIDLSSHSGSHDFASKTSAPAASQGLVANLLARRRGQDDQRNISCGLVGGTRLAAMGIDYTGRAGLASDQQRNAACLAKSSGLDLMIGAHDHDAPWFPVDAVLDLPPLEIQLGNLAVDRFQIAAVLRKSVEPLRDVAEDSLQPGSDRRGKAQTRRELERERHANK
jgi:hypothetical protein